MHIQTPLLDCRGLGDDAATQVRLKMECYQPTGTFKIRGIGNLCRQLLDAGVSSLVSSSGGNAGYAAAYAAKQLSTPITVFVPSTTSTAAIRRLQEMHARVVVEGDDWNAADQAARELVKSESAGYVPPFDDPAIWAGNSTVIGELVSQGPRPDAVITAVGGGGLLCGVAEGLEKAGWDDVELIAVSTTGADAFYQSVKAGQLVELPAITSIAKSLGARKVTQAALDWYQRRSISSVVVSDQSALNACYRFADEHQTLVEPACGASLSLVYENHEILKPYRNIVVIVCGGIGVTLELLQSWRQQLADL